MIPLGVLASARRAPAVIMTDSFNRADGALGVADTGQTWSGHSTVFSVASNAARNNAATNAASVINFGSADQKVTVRLGTGAAAGAVVRSASNCASMYRVSYFSGRWYIVKHGPSFPSESFLHDWAQTYVAGDLMTVRAVTGTGGNVDFTIYRNGVSVKTYTDSVHKLSGTYAGMFGTTTATLDDFKAETP